MTPVPAAPLDAVTYRQIEQHIVMMVHIYTTLHW